MIPAPTTGVITTPGSEPPVTIRPVMPRGIGALLPRDRASETLVLRHAAAIAAALGQPLTIARVIELTPADAPADPIDWHLRALELRAELERLKASEIADPELEIRADVLEGGRAWQVHRWTTERALDLLVLSRHDHAFAPLFMHQRMSGSALSLLIVPGARRGERVTPPYTRILVPLDGSARAESALPLATRLAQASRAELLLVHAVPPVELTEAGPLSSEDLDLLRLVRHRNERVGRTYLEGVRTRLGVDAHPVRTIVTGNGDVRRNLMRVIEREGADLVVLSAHGRGACDVSCGSVAAYLVARATVPLLLYQGVPGGERPGAVRQAPAGVAFDRMVHARP